MPKTIERTRRSAEELVAELQAKIESIKQRAERAKAKKDPALRHISGALRAVEKAASSTDDAATRKALEEARATLAATLALNGVGVRTSATLRIRNARPADLGDRLLAHVQKNPGARGEEIAAALGTDTVTMRPVMKNLIGDGQVRTEGQRRGMRYFAAG
jgi:hypothetical protein